MASLNHVCMWSDNGWKRITAEKAAELHPGGTVSSHSGLFMCELCGQYVSLTDGEVKTRHFRHSAFEKSKNCPERLSGAGCLVSYSPQEHELPICITVEPSSSFRFELGLIRAPISSLKKNFRVKIKPKGIEDVRYTYAKERLNCDSITYLPIGERPFEKYTLDFENGSDELHRFWPKEINGIDPNGTLFEKGSGKKLTHDADVEINTEYYLLKRDSGISPRRGIKVQKIVKTKFYGESWTLYVVSALEFCEESARFFIDFHCRLTEHPVSLQPVWPLFVEESYIVKHSQNSMYMLVKGDVAAFKTFPLSAVRQLNHDDYSKLYKVFCLSRQQLISVGRTRALQYTYYWNEPLNKVGLSPKISVTDLSGSAVDPCETNVLPYKKILLFESTFDGELIISNNDHVVDKRKMVAGEQIELNELTFGINIQVIVGLDVVWQIVFKRQRSTITDDEDKILRRIDSAAGASIPAPHSLRNILVGMSCYPKICGWIRKCIKNDAINIHSYRNLQNIYRSLDTIKHGEKL